MPCARSMLRLCSGVAIALIGALTTTGAVAQRRGAALRVEITVPVTAHAAPITGRAFFLISRQSDPEPRFQAARTGAPFFGRDIERLAPGKPAVIDTTDLGSPVESLADLPAGDYFVQAMVNVYSEFRRADGHVVWMHDDQWEGQNWRRSPGNLYSDVSRVHIDPTAGGVIRLSARNVVPAVQVPPDTKWVRRLKIESPLLTKFWGRPVYLGATVLLPRDFDTTTTQYPVHYVQGHFSLAPPLGFEEKGAFYDEWVKDDFPRMVVVTLQHPNPYFDDSYGVNSANVGPYGDALMQELVPKVEESFRVIRQPYARTLSGGSTGGWISLAHQLLYPDFYGGVWSYCPDSVTFSDVEGIDIYADANAFHKQIGWRQVFTANSREADGRIRMTSQQRNYYELVSGTKGRSGEQLDIWSAVYGPVGKDGYFEPLFDKRSGVINPAVAQYWREHYDLLEHMKRNWSTLGAAITGKIHVYTGDMDNFYLNNSTREMELWMRSSTNPQYRGFFMYGDGRGHCFTGAPSQTDRLLEIAEHVAKHAPAGTATPWWSRQRTTARHDSRQPPVFTFEPRVATLPRADGTWRADALNVGRGDGIVRERAPIRR